MEPVDQGLAREAQSFGSPHVPPRGAHRCGDAVLTRLLSVPTASKNMAGKSREEIALEKQMELERRLMDVSGQLNSGKKPVKTKRKFNPGRKFLLSVHQYLFSPG